MAVNCSALSDPTLCQTMESAGAGLGVFFEYLQASLPGFLLILAVIGAIVGVFAAIVYVIKKSISGVHRK